MPTLRVKSGPLAGQTIEVQGDLTSARQSADITIDDAQLSRRHAVVRLLADGLEVKDLERIRAHAEKSSAGVA